MLIMDKTKHVVKSEVKGTSKETHKRTLQRQYIKISKDNSKI